MFKFHTRYKSLKKIAKLAIGFVKMNYIKLEEFVLSKFVIPNLLFFFKFQFIWNFCQKFFYWPIKKFINLLATTLKFFRIIPDWSSKTKWKKSEEYSALMDEDLFRPFILFRPLKLWAIWSYFFAIFLELLYRLVYIIEDIWFKWLDYPFYLFAVKFSNLGLNIFVKTDLAINIAVFFWNRDRQQLFESFWEYEAFSDLDTIVSEYSHIYFRIRIQYIFFLFKHFSKVCYFNLFLIKRKIIFFKNLSVYRYNYYILKNFGIKQIRINNNFFLIKKIIRICLKFVSFTFYVYTFKLFYFKSLFYLENKLEFFYFKFLRYFSFEFLIFIVDKVFKSNFYRILLTIRLLFAIFYPEYLFMKNLRSYFGLWIFRISFLITIFFIFVLNSWATLPAKYVIYSRRSTYDLDFGRYKIMVSTDILDFSVFEKINYLIANFFVNTSFYLTPLDFISVFPFIVLLILVLPFTSILWRHSFDNVFFETSNLDERAKRIAFILRLDYNKLLKKVKNKKQEFLKNIPAINEGTSTNENFIDSINDDLWNDLHDSQNLEYDSSLANHVTTYKLNRSDFYHEWYNMTGVWDPSWVQNPILEYYYASGNILQNDEDGDVQELDIEHPDSSSNSAEFDLKETKYYRDIIDPIIQDLMLSSEINKDGTTLSQYSLELNLIAYRSPVESDYSTNLDCSKYPVVSLDYYKLKFPMFIKPTRNVYSPMVAYFYETDLFRQDPEDESSYEIRPQYINTFYESDYNEMYDYTASFEDQYLDFKNDTLNNAWIMDERSFEPFKYDTFSSSTNIFSGDNSASYFRYEFLNFNQFDNHLNSEFEFFYTAIPNNIDDYILDQEDIFLSNDKVFDLFSELLNDSILLNDQKDLKSDVPKNNQKLHFAHSLFTFDYEPFFVCCLGFFVAVFLDIEYFIRWSHQDFVTPFYDVRRDKMHFRQSTGRPLVFALWALILYLIMIISRSILDFDHFYLFSAKFIFKKMKSNWFPQIFVWKDLLNSQTVFWPKNSFFMSNFMNKNSFDSEFYTNQHVNIVDEPLVYFKKLQDLDSSGSLDNFDDNSTPETFNTQIYNFYDDVENFYVQFFLEPSRTFTYEHIEDMFSPMSMGVRSVGYPFNSYELILWLSLFGGVYTLKERLLLQLDWILWYRWRSYYGRASAGLLVPRYISLLDEHDFYDKLDVNRIQTKLHNITDYHNPSSFQNLGNLSLNLNEIKRLRKNLIEIHQLKLNLYTRVIKKFPDRKIFYFTKNYITK